MRSRFDNPETQAIYDALRENTRDMLTIEADGVWGEPLPEELQDKRFLTGERSFTDLHRIIDSKNAAKSDKLSQHKQDKADKAKRIEAYRAQIESGQECIDYDVDEDRQFAKMLTFAQRATQAGMMSDES